MRIPLPQRKPKPDPIAIEQADYPSGRTVTMGENLRHLSDDRSSYIPPCRPQSIEPCIDAIVVPTVRPIQQTRSYIRRIMQLADELPHTALIFLCSGKSQKEDISRIADGFPGVTWLAIEGSFLAHNERLALRTTSSPIALDGFSDLAAKRNLALRIARQMGWGSIFLLDDDLDITAAHIRKAADLLSSGASVVAYSVSKYPDHSILGHAYRWAGGALDCFIGGGAMAIKTDGPILAFFPHIYDEDWLFGLSYHLFNNGLVWAGTLRQRRYKPFRTPDRAFIEEPGDLLAESLFNLAMSLKPRKKPRTLDEALDEIIEHADEDYWQREITKRILFVQKTIDLVNKKPPYTPGKRQAIRALHATLSALIGVDGKGGITPSDLVGWLKNWRHDLQTWTELNKTIGHAQLIPEAIHALDVTLPYIYKEGIPRVPKLRSVTMPVLTESELFTKLQQKQRPKHVVKGAINTSLVQHYLYTHNLSMYDLVVSADRLQRARPAFTDYRPQPVATVGILIAHGESTQDIINTIRKIIEWNGKQRCIQIIAWLYEEYSPMAQNLQEYRANLSLQLLDELMGTHICLYTSIIRRVEGLNLDQIIQSVSEDMVLSYWKYGIDHTDHPVFVINSAGEALRWGNFWQLVDQQHRMPNKSLQVYLQGLPSVSKNTKDADYSQNLDAEADARSRVILHDRIFHKQPRKPILEPIREHLKHAPTRKLINMMRKQELGWIEVNDDAYEYRCYTLSPEMLQYAEASVSYCMPVHITNLSTHHLHEACRDIQRALAKLGFPKKNDHLTIFLLYPTGLPYSELQAFRDNLMQLLMKKWSHGDMILNSMTYQTDEPTLTGALREHLTTSMYYTHWIENHHNVPRIKWLKRPLHVTEKS